jgi:hypothetical protein
MSTGTGTFTNNVTGTFKNNVPVHDTGTTHDGVAVATPSIDAGRSGGKIGQRHYPVAQNLGDVATAVVKRIGSRA